MVDKRKIEKVLGMFDAKDIPYINPKLRFKMINYNKSKINLNNRVKVKRVGVYNVSKQR